MSKIFSNLSKNYDSLGSNIFNKFKLLLDGGFLHLLSSNYAIKLFGFASQLFVAWILTKEDMGRIGVLQNFFMIFLVIAGFGFGESILKFSSEKISKEESYSIYYYGNKYAIFTCIFAYVLGFILAQLGVFSPDPKINFYIPFYFLSLLPMALNNNALAYLRARQKLKEFARIQIITKLAGIILVIILTYFYLLPGFIIALTLGNLFTFVWIEIYKRKVKFPIIKGKYLNKHLNYSVPSVLANIIGSFTNNMDILFLNYVLLNRELLGAYSFAIVLNGVLNTFSQSIQQYIIPKFSESSHNFNEILMKLQNYQKKWIPFAAIILFGVLITFIPFLIFFNGGKYYNSIIPFIILGVVWFFRSFVAIQGAMFFGSGLVKINLKNSILYFIVNALSIPLLYYQFGFIGVPFAVLLSIIICFLIYSFQINKLMKLH